MLVRLFLKMLSVWKLLQRADWRNNMTANTCYFRKYYKASQEMVILDQMSREPLRPRVKGWVWLVSGFEYFKLTCRYVK